MKFIKLFFIFILFSNCVNKNLSFKSNVPIKYCCVSIENKIIKVNTSVILGLDAKYNIDKFQINKLQITGALKEYQYIRDSIKNVDGYFFINKIREKVNIYSFSQNELSKINYCGYVNSDGTFLINEPNKIHKIYFFSKLNLDSINNSYDCFTGVVTR